MHPITLSSKTDVGKERDNNEDSVVSEILDGIKDNGFDCAILAVADGMGGYEKGEVASKMATKIFIEEVKQNILQFSNDWSKLEFPKILLKSIKSANKEVWKISNNKSNRMGTTIVGAIIVNDKIFIANVGDSRAYLITPKKSALLITKDHSAVQEMLDANIITKEQAINHPRKNIITRALGLEEDVQIDLFENTLGDKVLMLCSDGLYNMVEEEEIINSINGNISKSADTLISLANKHGGKDNISIALASH